MRPGNANTKARAGDWTTGVSADHILDLSFVFDVTNTQAGSSFTTDFLLGNGTPTVAAIPEPSTYVLFSFGLLGSRCEYFQV